MLSRSKDADANEGPTDDATSPPASSGDTDGVKADPGFNYGPHIARLEFENPDQLAHDLLEKVAIARTAVGQPFNFTRRPGGATIVAGRDAVPPDAGSHSAFSLHRFGIDHTASFLEHRLVRDPGQPGKALDFDIDVENADDFLDAIRTLTDTVRWGGFGIYPHWSPRPGFHVDVRGPDHPMAGLIWHRDVEGRYRYHPNRWKVSWQELKGEVAGLRDRIGSRPAPSAPRRRRKRPSRSQSSA